MKAAWTSFLVVLGCLVALFFAQIGILAIIQRQAYPLLMRYTTSVSGMVAMLVGVAWLALGVAAFGFTVLRTLPQTRQVGGRIATGAIFAFFAFEAAATLMQVVKVYFGVVL